MCKNKEVNEQTWNEGNGYRAAAAVENKACAMQAHQKKRFLLLK